MEEMRILSPTGVLGSGFVETSFEAALARQPHFIGCDAGSTDPGPRILIGTPGQIGTSPLMHNRSAP
jgi:hypothetical protein